MQIFVTLSFESFTLPYYQLWSSINIWILICNFTFLSWLKSCPMAESVLHKTGLPSASGLGYQTSPPQPHMFVFVFMSYTFVFISWQKSCPIGRVGPPPTPRWRCVSLLLFCLSPHHTKRNTTLMLFKQTWCDHILAHPEVWEERRVQKFQQCFHYPNVLL